MGNTTLENDAQWESQMTELHLNMLIKVENLTQLAIGENILTQISKSPIAQKLFRQVVDRSLTTTALMAQLGITRIALKLSKKYQVFTQLIEAREYYKMLSNIKIDPVKDGIMKNMFSNSCSKKRSKGY